MHKSVLLDEVVSYLNLTDDKVIVDCTLGYGGHSGEILKRIKRGFLFAFDQDIDAISYSTNHLSNIGSNYEIIKSNFVNLKSELNKRNVDKVDGFLFDLGVSSVQLDQVDRGFSFHNDAALDMRMDKSGTLDAYYVVNNYDEKELVRVLRDYGEEKYASSIARGIVNARKIKPIETTLELVDVISNNVPMKYKRDTHPARRTFQAIRIEVNDELNVFKFALEDALSMLKVGGRVCVITFHSLEDRICMNVFRKNSKIDGEIAKMPIVPDEYLPKFKILANVLPSDTEINNNNRARSAHLRVIERIKN